MNAQSPSLHDAYNALIDKHGGFFWRDAGTRGGSESVFFATEEQRIAFDREWKAMGGPFEKPPEVIDENDYDLAHLRGSL